MFVGDKGILLADYGKRILLPRGRLQGLPAAEAVDRPVAGPSPGMDPRLQDRRADALQLRLLRHAGRAQPAGHGRLPRRQEARVGPGEPEGPQLPRGRAVHPAAVSRRLDAVIGRAGLQPHHFRRTTDDGRRAGVLPSVLRRPSSVVLLVGLAASTHPTTRSHLTCPTYCKEPAVYRPIACVSVCVVLLFAAGRAWGETLKVGPGREIRQALAGLRGRQGRRRDRDRRRRQPTPATWPRSGPTG